MSLNELGQCLRATHAECPQGVDLAYDRQPVIEAPSIREQRRQPVSVVRLNDAS
ncbi:hypothetical protein SAMN05446934_9303 [Paraburkholderia hospita]|jgi:hypothetical protein|nr:hypothetical protein SAMN05446934_9303 [Paraburkholderia hospita]